MYDTRPTSLYLLNKYSIIIIMMCVQLNRSILNKYFILSLCSAGRPHYIRIRARIDPTLLLLKYDGRPNVQNLQCYK